MPDTNHTDPDGMNEDRANRAADAVNVFATASYDHLGEDDETILGDLLCNLHHYADRLSLDFPKIADRAERAHAEESGKRQIAPAPASQRFIASIARMETQSEFEGSEEDFEIDSAMTISELIARARVLCGYAYEMNEEPASKAART